MNIIPKSRVGRFLFFGLTQALSYFLIVANTRAFTQGLYGWTALTDGTIASQSFLMIRLIAKSDAADGPWAFAGTVIGGVAGSLLSICVTKHLFGH